MFFITLHYNFVIQVGTGRALVLVSRRGQRRSCTRSARTAEGFWTLFVPVTFFWCHKLSRLARLGPPYPGGAVYVACALARRRGQCRSCGVAASEDVWTSRIQSVLIPLLLLLLECKRTKATMIAVESMVVSLKACGQKLKCE